MKLQSLMLRNSLLLLTSLLALPAFRAAAQSKPDAAGAATAQAAATPARITQAIDETQLVRLRGNVHPLARPEFDQGLVGDATPMKRMMLVLQRSPEQQAALSKLMDEQLSKDSPNFHNWLTPEQFGKQFGPADADIQTVTSWLARHGFQQIKVGAGRTAIEFSGNVAQVRNAFHTEIHQFNVNGESRQANLNDPQLPAALTPVVAGVLSLHNFPRKSMRHVAGIFTHMPDGSVIPQFTGSNGSFYAVGPADFAKIYNIPSTLDGTGQAIAIVGDSNISPQDVTDFRALFGLPVNPPNIILNGPDPGISGPTGSEGEADLDVQISGMVAPQATIDFVVSEGTLTAQGIDLSSFYIIDNNIAPVMSLSFGACEPALGTAGNQFFNGLWEQAAAQGISVFVSAGDPGSAGCDDFNTATVATHGLAVSGFASTPFNVAVGGTDFDDFTTQTTFWSPTNSTDGKRESALGYIHEIPWNNSCAANATSANLSTVCAGTLATNIVGGSGGPSSVYAKPAWQSGIIPNGIAAGDNHRYTPDVSLFASNGPQSKSFYLVCQADGITAGSPPSCVPDAQGHFSFFGTGGTSASSPAFAAIMALINQSTGIRQGNPNPVLYKIAATAGQSCNSSTTPLTGSATCSFYDITKGNNSVPCAANSPAGTSPNCSSTTAGTNGVLVSPAATTTPAWTAATGYDLATGLGSVNVANLATQWPLAVGNFHATTTTLTVNGSTTPPAITHGTAATVKVTVTSTTAGTITGDVGLLAPTSVNGGIGDGPLSGGVANITGVILPGGSYNLNARYAGDTTFASSTSAPGVPVVVNKENSRLQYGIVTFDAMGHITSTNSTSFVYGSPYILRFDILNSTTSACTPLAATPATAGCAFDATGTVTITDNGGPLDTSPFPVNSAGSGEDQPIQLTGGTHALSATYSGDISYNAVTTPVTDTVTVAKATTATALSGASTVIAGTNTVVTATISSASNSAVGATGTVTFFNGGTQIGNPVPVTPTAVSATAGAGGNAALTTSFASPGTESITATYNGDTNYALSSATAISITVNSPGTFTLSNGSGTITATAGTTPNTVTIPITVTPSGGFTGTVAITCPTAGAGAGSLPFGVSCNALSITIPASTTAPVTQSLTVSLTPPSPTMSAFAAPAERRFYAAGLLSSPGAKGWWAFSASTGFVAMLFLVLPGRKRYRAALALGIVCLLGFTLGCNSYNNGGGGGPVATTTALAVTPATKNPTNATITITPYSGPAVQGSASLNDLSAGTSTQVSLTNGVGLANLTLGTPGTHSLQANYGGSTADAASKSGMLNVTLTGGPQAATITGTSGSTTATATINITIN